jgi:hypothetical protein
MQKRKQLDENSDFDSPCWIGLSFQVDMERHRNANPTQKRNRKKVGKTFKFLQRSYFNRHFELKAPSSVELMKFASKISSHISFQTHGSLKNQHRLKKCGYGLLTKNWQKNSKKNIITTNYFGLE